MNYSTNDRSWKVVFGKPQRIVAVIALLLLFIGSCTGKGCSCAGCQSCQKPEGPAGSEKPIGKTTLTGPAGGATIQPGATVQPGTTAGGTPGETTAQLPPPNQIPPRTLEEIVKNGEGENPPPAPGNLIAAVLPNSVVSLSWDDLAENKTGFQVDRASGSGEFSLAYRLGPNRKTVIDGPLAPGAYSYRVRTILKNGASPFAGPATVIIEEEKEPPATPTGLAAVPDSSLEVLLTWRSGSENTEYFRLEKSEEGADFINLGMVNPETLIYLDDLVESDMTYRYRVIAGNAAGESPPSNEASAKIKGADKAPKAPSKLTVKVAGPNAVSLSWKDNSDNEDRFLIEKTLPGTDRFFPFAEVSRDVVKLLVGEMASGQEASFRVLAENEFGKSDPSNEVTVTPVGGALATYMINVSPSGELQVSQPDDPLLPRLIVESAALEGGELIAMISVFNPDPDHQLEDVYVLIEEMEGPGVFLNDCDWGPESCSIEQGLASATPVGYQYVEGGYEQKALHGGETNYYPSRDRTFAVRDVWPACGRVTVEWRFAGLTGPVKLAANLYGSRTPADFILDSRYNPDMSTWVIEPYTIGLADKVNEPGSRLNPTARPVHFLKNGDLFAVNISIEAADWMEKEGSRARILDSPEAYYTYYFTLAFALLYDPAVIMPIKQVVRIDGGFIAPGIRFPLLFPQAAANGWSAAQCMYPVYPDQGYMGAICHYPPFRADADDDGNLVCKYCGQEGFMTESGVIQGPDPEPEVNLAVIYFQVIGESGSGAALRMAPQLESLISIKSTNGTLPDIKDDPSLNRWLEINKLLPPTFQLPGDYQVRESYICVE